MRQFFVDILSMHYAVSSIVVASMLYRPPSGERGVDPMTSDNTPLIWPQSRPPLAGYIIPKVAVTVWLHWMRYGATLLITMTGPTESTDWQFVNDPCTVLLLVMLYYSLACSLLLSLLCAIIIGLLYVFSISEHVSATKYKQMMHCLLYTSPSPRD